MEDIFNFSLWQLIMYFFGATTGIIMAIIAYMAGKDIMETRKEKKEENAKKNNTNKRAA